MAALNMLFETVRYAAKSDAWTTYGFMSREYLHKEDSSRQQPGKGLAWLGQKTEFYDVSHWGGTSAAYFLLMFLYLFLTIFPCSIVEIKLTGFSFEEEGDYRQVKECAVSGILLIQPGNTGERERLGKLGKYHSLYY